MNMNEDSGKNVWRKSKKSILMGSMNEHDGTRGQVLVDFEDAFYFWAWKIPDSWIFLLRPFPTVGSVKSGLQSKCVTPVGSFKRYQKVRCWRLAKWQVCKEMLAIAGTVTIGVQWFPCRDHHWCILMHIDAYFGIQWSSIPERWDVESVRKLLDPVVGEIPCNHVLKFWTICIF